MNGQALNLNYYALQVKTNGEEKFMRQARAQIPDIPFSLHFPRRALDICKGGKIKPSHFAVFPGYVFLEIDKDDDIHQYLYFFRKTDGFYRFLRSNLDITPLHDRDLEIILHFIKIGISGKSKVCFDENSRIMVLAGPLSGLEGNIVKIDKRKKRAKIKLDLYSDSFFIDLAFEVIAKAQG